MFAKIIDGKIVFPPSMLTGVPRTFPAEDEDGEPTTGLYKVGYDPENIPDYVEAYLRDNGWLPVVTSQRPEDGDGFYYVDGYELGHDDTTDTDEIVQVWERREVEPEPPSIEDGLRILLGGATNA